MNYPLPPAGHPRLFARESDLPQIRQKLQGPRMKELYDMVRSWTEGEHHVDRLDFVGYKDCDDARREKVEANAVLYLLEKDEAAGRAAVKGVQDYIAFMLQEHDDPAKCNDNTYRMIGHTLFTGALVYDWCYDLLDQETKDKLIQSFLKLASKQEIGYPPVRASAVTGHSGEADLMRNLLSAGIAVFDEFQEIYHIAAERFFGEFVPARNFFYPAHYHHQGDSYGPWRFEWEMFPTWIFARMGYRDIFVQDQGQVPYHWIYTRRPDGQLVRDGDTYYEKFAFDTYWGAQDATLTDSLIMAASYYQDPYLQDELDRCLEYAPYPGRCHVVFLLIADLDMPAKPVSELPLTRYFGSPVGAMVARTGWNNDRSSNDLIAFMKVGEMHFANHQHLDSGQFQLYCRGPLAIDSGLYVGKEAYGSPHFKNYFQRTIAHNCLLVIDPEEVFAGDPQLANDGGQRWPNYWKEAKTLDELLEADYRKAEVLKTSVGPDSLRPEFSYLKGDLTGAYSKKVEKAERTFVFLNFGNAQHPGALIVFDRVAASSPDFKKIFLLHTMEEPAVNGNKAVLSLGEHGHSGQLTMHSLLPEQVALEKVGGPGKEFEVFGRTYPNPQAPRGNWRGGFEDGQWRVQASPSSASAADLFLNVLAAHGPEAEAPRFEKVEAEGMIGVRGENRIVLFSRSGEPVSDPVSVDLAGAGQAARVLLTDMAPGEWKIGETGETITVLGSSGTLFFTGTGKSVTVAPVNLNAANKIKG